MTSAEHKVVACHGRRLCTYIEAFSIWMLMELFHAGLDFKVTTQRGVGTSFVARVPAEATRVVEDDAYSRLVATAK